MTFSDELLQDLARQAVTAALAAGRIIDAHRDSAVAVRHKATGTSAAAQVVTEVDHKAQAAILELLEPTCVEYGLALLTEESPDDGERQHKPAFWSIDPMDGTLPFTQGIPGFSVSIALVARDGSPLIGVVYDPVEQSLFQAVRGHGTFRNGQAMQLPPLDPARPLVLHTDLSFEPHPWLEATRAGLRDIADLLGLNGAEVRFQTGGVLNACGVLEDPNRCYFKYPKPGGGSLWDYAATACLFQELGAVASDIHGAPMELNRPDSTFMNHHGLLYASHRAVADRIVALHRALADTERARSGR